MPRRTKNPETPPPATTRGGQRILDLFDIERGGLDNLLVLDKLSVTRPKGVLAATLQFTQDLDGLEDATWPDWLAPVRPALLAAMLSEESSEKSEKTRNVDAKVNVVLVDGDRQERMIVERRARIWKVKAVASPGAGEVRWYVQFAGDWLAGLGDSLFTMLGRSCAISTLPAQGSLLPTRDASELPPEPGDSVVQ